MTEILQAKEIHKEFHHPTKTLVLQGINISVNKGESIAIMGASGEGKTTLLNILGTLEKPTSGSLYINGQDINKTNRAKLRNEKIGFIFQFFHLLEDYSVIENVLMPASIARQKNKMQKRAKELLEKVQLSHRTNYPANLLSGGEQQRVAIARALCNDPEIILADEPTGNLDHKTSQEIHQLLITLAKEENKTLIIATHDKELANLCHSKYILQDGQLKSF